MTLLIHTGGTIGMVESAQGLIPAKGVVEAAVAGRARVVSFDPLLDSADVGPQHWKQMLDLIEAEAGPVVITHGTDTMSYTGAALSVALEGWGERVVLTGAMHPLGHGKDAEANLDLALAAEVPAGLWLAFASRLMPADNLVKSSSSEEDAFRVVARETTQPSAFKSWRFKEEAQLATLTITPGISAAFLRRALAGLDGAVLRVFGSGTIPSRPDLFEALQEARSNGVLLRAVSACENGGVVPGTYAAGAGLWAAGVEDGGAETAEAALAQLWKRVSLKG